MRSVIVFGKEVQHFLAIGVELRVLQQRLAVARARQIDLQHLADGGIGAVLKTLKVSGSNTKGAGTEKVAVRSRMG